MDVSENCDDLDVSETSLRDEALWRTRERLLWEASTRVFEDSRHSLRELDIVPSTQFSPALRADAGDDLALRVERLRLVKDDVVAPLERALAE